MASDKDKMAFTKKPDWIDARCKCALALNSNGDQIEALNVIDESINKLAEKWKLLVCKAVIKQRVDEDWKSDLRKAEEIAHTANENSEFKAYVKERDLLLP